MRAVMVLGALACAIAAVTVTSTALSLGDFTVPDGQVSWDTVRATLMRGVDDSTPHTFFKGLMENTVAQLPRAVRHHGPATSTRGKGQYRADGTPNFGPWFGWIPLFMDSAVPASEESDAVVGSWSAPCFQNNTLSVSLNTDGSGAVLTITSTNPSTLLCSDWYLIGCLEGLVFKTQDSLSPGASEIKYTFKTAISASELADLKVNGFRVFRFLDDVATTLVDLYDTIMLFLPAMMTTGPVPQTCAEANLAFLDAYVDIQMEARNTTVVSIDEGLVQSGDLFGIIRLDGLDPMLAWAMGGSHTGHTTVAMRSTDGVLHVCESTTKDNYWPTNGIQCTPFQQWITQAINADYNVLWLPLSQQSRGVFNNTKAWDYVNADLNLNYGFGNMLWAWVDTESDNYPWPLTWQAHELLPAWLGKLSETIADLLWAQAFNIRVGSQPQKLNIPDVYAKARAQGLDFGALSSLAEQDSWMYSQPDNNGTSVYGHSSVCDVFVCRVWKEAGLFGDTDFQCTEATNWDIYTLDIFEQNVALPPQCTAADPELPYCQLVGKYRMRLPQFNTRQIYTNSFANCPRGSPPDFNKPVGC